LLRVLRRLLRPILKLFFNPDTLTTALHQQSQLNAHLIRLDQHEPLMYELIHNLTVEITRLGIEVQTLKMRVESLSSRLDFDERRGRALESVVQYRPAPRQAQISRPEANSSRRCRTRAPRMSPCCWRNSWRARQPSRRRARRPGNP